MKLQKTISVLTALFLAMQCAVLPAWAESAEPVPTGSYQINPIGSDLLPEDLPEPEGEQGETLFVEQAAVYYTTVEDAADAIMDAMKRREAAISVGVTREVYDILNSTDAHPHNVLFDAACEHDPDDPTAGDYHGQLYHYWQSDATSWSGNNATIVYHVVYRTTLAEEQQVDAAVAELVAQWTAADMNTYETICTIYDYITENVVYDYDGLDAGDLHVYTAYKGLIEGTAVCMGIANLFYRLAMEMGIDARMIHSIERENHTWNIVEVDGLYYNLDATWDLGCLATGYGWFLKNMDDFVSHTRRDDYLTETFMAEYPMSENSERYLWEMNIGEICFDVPKRTTVWDTDGYFVQGEYFEIFKDYSWISAATGNPNKLVDAKRLPFTLAMSWDEMYLYTFMSIYDADGHCNTYGDDPSSMWAVGCVQGAFAEKDSTGTDRLEYGVALTSDTNRKISAVWSDYLGSGYAVPEEDFAITIDGSWVIYEFRTPISAFSETAAEEGAQYSCSYNLSWGNDMSDYTHTQLGSGITGYAGKAAENFMNITLVDKRSFAGVVEGTDLTWNLDENGCLTVTGTDSIPDYDMVDPPWFPYRWEITSLDLQLTGENIEIGEWAFSRLFNITSVTIPDSVTCVDAYAFDACYWLKSVVIGKNTAEIGSCAFRNCSDLVEAYFKGDVPASFGENVFEGTASDFVIVYNKGAEGWDTPTWSPNEYETYNTIAKETPGDLTGDGKTDEDDAAMISAWFAGMYAEIPFDPEMADCNGDGKFTRADGMYLARALAGWEGYTLP